MYNLISQPMHWLTAALASLKAIDWIGRNRHQRKPRPVEAQVRRYDTLRMGAKSIMPLFNPSPIAEADNTRRDALSLLSRVGVARIASKCRQWTLSYPLPPSRKRLLLPESPV